MEFVAIYTRGARVRVRISVARASKAARNFIPFTELRGRGKSSAVDSRTENVLYRRRIAQCEICIREQDGKCDYI